MANYDNHCFETRDKYLEYFGQKTKEILAPKRKEPTDKDYINGANLLLKRLRRNPTDITTQDLALELKMVIERSNRHVGTFDGPIIPGEERIAGLLDCESDPYSVQTIRSELRSLSPNKNKFTSLPENVEQ